MFKRLLLICSITVFCAPNLNSFAQQSGSLSKILNKKAKSDSTKKSKSGSLKNIIQNKSRINEKPSQQQSTRPNKSQINEKPSQQQNIKQKNLTDEGKTYQNSKEEPEQISNTLYIIIGALALIVILLMMRKGGKGEEKNTDQNNKDVEDAVITYDNKDKIQTEKVNEVSSSSGSKIEETSYEIEEDDLETIIEENDVIIEIGGIILQESDEDQKIHEDNFISWNPNIPIPIKVLRLGDEKELNLPFKNIPVDPDFSGNSHSNSFEHLEYEDFWVTDDEYSFAGVVDNYIEWLNEKRLMENASLAENSQNIENTSPEETQSEKENELVSSESNDEEIETHKGVENKDEHIPHQLKNDDGSVLISNVKDFYRMTLNYEDSSLDHCIIVYYDGGKDFPNFDSDSDCNILKFNTAKDFMKWSDIPSNKPENISESKLYETMVNSNRFWQIAEGKLILEWNGVELSSGGSLKVWPSEEMIVHPITKEDSLKSELMVSKNSVLPSIRKFFGNDIDWVVEYEADVKARIRNLLTEKNIKIAVSDIDTFLKHQDVDEIKRVCEEMYQNEEISFAGNGRYFVMSEVDENTKKSTEPESGELDIEDELEKLKVLLDKGLIEQEDYDAKKDELLGL